MKPRIFALGVALFAVVFAPAIRAQVDDAKASAIRELVEASQVEQMAEQMIGLFNRDILPSLLEANPGQGERVQEIISEEVTAAMMSLKDEVVALTETVWAKHFTTEEIRALTDFYTTPLGRKLLEKQPIIAAESMQAGMQLSQQAATKAMERIKARLQEEDLSLPDRL